MKRKKEISIKNPHLRAIRNNLREILWLEWDRRSCDIIDAQLNVYDLKLPQGEMMRLHGELEVKLGENRIIMKPSIVMCGWCHHRDKDAIYNPSNHQWFCPNCYDDHREDILTAESFIY